MSNEEIPEEEVLRFMERAGIRPTSVGGEKVRSQEAEHGAIESGQGLGDQAPVAREAGPEVDDAYLRLLADFENHKRHVMRQLEEARAHGRDELVRALVPVLADLRAAVQAPGRDVEDFRRGLEMILERLERTLRSFGYERVPTEGEALDPSRHEAVAVVSSREWRGTIVAEVSPGYTRAGNLVQPARVVVAGGPLAE